MPTEFAHIVDKIQNSGILSKLHLLLKFTSFCDPLWSVSDQLGCRK